MRRTYAILAIIGLIGFFTILALTTGLYYIAMHDVKERALGIAFILLGILLLVAWERSIKYFGSRFSYFSYRYRRSP